MPEKEAKPFKLPALPPHVDPSPYIITDPKGVIGGDGKHYPQFTPLREIPHSRQHLITWSYFGQVGLAPEKEDA